MNTFSFNLLSNGLSSRPGNSWFLVLDKNFLRKRLLKFSTFAPEVWATPTLVSNTSSSGFDGDV